MFYLKNQTDSMYQFFYYITSDVFLYVRIYLKRRKNKLNTLNFFIFISFNYEL